jgi:hypothetical protein
MDRGKPGQAWLQNRVASLKRLGLRCSSASTARRLCGDPESAMGAVPVAGAEAVRSAAVRG